MKPARALPSWFSWRLFPSPAAHRPSQTPLHPAGTESLPFISDCAHGNTAPALEQLSPCAEHVPSLATTGSAHPIQPCHIPRASSLCPMVLASLLLHSSSSLQQHPRQGRSWLCSDSPGLPRKQRVVGRGWWAQGPAPQHPAASPGVTYTRVPCARSLLYLGHGLKCSAGKTVTRCHGAQEEALGARTPITHPCGSSTLRAPLQGCCIPGNAPWRDPSVREEQHPPAGMQRSLAPLLFNCSDAGAVRWRLHMVGQEAQ